MKVSPIHIKVNQLERRLFEVAAEKTGMTITGFIKKAVVAYVKGPLLKDEFAEALAHLETFTPTQAQIEEHRKTARGVELGELQGLGSKEGLELLNKLQAGSALREKKKSVQ